MPILDARPPLTARHCDLTHRPYVVILDLKYTAFEGSRERLWAGENEYREIVQIGGILCSNDAGEVLREVASFDVLVLPQINPVLSDYFTRLAGITQERLEEQGIDPHLAFDELDAFIDGAPVLSWGRDGRVLIENLRLSGIEWHPLERLTYRSVIPFVTQATGIDKNVASGDLAEKLGIDPAEIGSTGRWGANDALHDARSIAATLRHIMSGELSQTSRGAGYLTADSKIG